MWSALRALEERRALLERLARRAERSHHTLVAERFNRQIEGVAEQAATLRNLLLSKRGDGPSMAQGVA